MRRTRALLRPAARTRTAYQLHDRVLVARVGGLEPAEATITAENEHRPHLVKVRYASGTGAWIARARIVGPAPASSAVACQQPDLGRVAGRWPFVRRW